MNLRNLTYFNILALILVGFCSVDAANSQKVPIETAQLQARIISSTEITQLQLASLKDELEQMPIDLAYRKHMLEAIAHRDLSLKPEGRNLNEHVWQMSIKKALHSQGFYVKPNPQTFKPIADALCKHLKGELIMTDKALNNYRNQLEAIAKEELEKSLIGTLCHTLSTVIMAIQHPVNGAKEIVGPYFLIKAYQRIGYVQKENPDGTLCEFEFIQETEIELARKVFTSQLYERVRTSTDLSEIEKIEEELTKQKNNHLLSQSSFELFMKGIQLKKEEWPVPLNQFLPDFWKIPFIKALRQEGVVLEDLYYLGSWDLLITEIHQDLHEQAQNTDVLDRHWSLASFNYLKNNTDTIPSPAAKQAKFMYASLIKALNCRDNLSAARAHLNEAYQQCNLSLEPVNGSNEFTTKVIALYQARDMRAQWAKDARNKKLLIGVGAVISSGIAYRTRHKWLPFIQRFFNNRFKLAIKLPVKATIHKG